MKPHPVLFALLLGAGLAFTGCNSKPNPDAHEQEAHAVQPKRSSIATPPSLRDTLQRLAQQLDTVHRDGCWDEDFARVMTVHHAGAQRLAAVEIAQGKDSTLRALAQHTAQFEPAQTLGRGLIDRHHAHVSAAQPTRRYTASPRGGRRTK